MMSSSIVVLRRSSRLLPPIRRRVAAASSWVASGQQQGRRPLSRNHHLGMTIIPPVQQQQRPLHHYYVTSHLNNNNLVGDETHRRVAVASNNYTYTASSNDKFINNNNGHFTPTRGFSIITTSSPDAGVGGGRKRSDDDNGGENYSSKSVSSDDSIEVVKNIPSDKHKQHQQLIGIIPSAGDNEDDDESEEKTTKSVNYNGVVDLDHVDTGPPSHLVTYEERLQWYVKHGNIETARCLLLQAHKECYETASRNPGDNNTANLPIYLPTHVYNLVLWGMNNTADTISNNNKYTAKLLDLATQGKELLSLMWDTHDVNEHLGGDNNGNGCKPNVVTYKFVFQLYKKALFPHNDFINYEGKDSDDEDYHSISNTIIESFETIVNDLRRRLIMTDDPDLSNSFLVHNVIMEFFGKAGNVEKVLSLLDEMCVSCYMHGEDGMQPNDYSYVFVMLALSKQRVSSQNKSKLDLALELEGIIGRHRRLYDNKFAGCLDRLPTRILYNLAISCWKATHHPESAARATALLRDLQRSGVRPSQATYHNVLQAYAELGMPEEAESVLLEMYNDYTQNGNRYAIPCVHDYNSILVGWSREKNRRKDSPEMAESVIRSMWELHETKKLPNVKPTSLSYLFLINTWLASGRPQVANKAQGILETLHALYNQGDNEFKPDTVVYNRVILAHCRAGNATKAIEVLHSMKDHGVLPDKRTHSPLMNLCADKGLVEEAILLFDEICNDVFEGYMAAMPPVKFCGMVLKACVKSKAVDAPERATQFLSRIIQLSETNPSLASLRPNAWCYNLVIQSWLESKRPTVIYEIEKLFSQMKTEARNGHTEAKPDPLTYGHHIYAYSLTGNDIGRDSQVCDRVTELLGEWLDMSDANDQRSQPEKDHYDIVLEILAKRQTNNKVNKMKVVLDKMKEHNVAPQHIRACTRRLRAAKQVRMFSSNALCSSSERFQRSPPTMALPKRAIHIKQPEQWTAKQPQHHQHRNFARTSDMGPTDDSNSPEAKARNLVIQIGHDKDVAEGVVKALKQSGMSGTSLLSMVRSMAGRWEVGEDAGLEALVESVKLQMAREQGKKPITLYVVPGSAWFGSSEEDQEDFTEVVLPDDPVTMEEHNKVILSKAFKVQAMTGLTLTDVAKFGDGEGASLLGEYIECACSGIMACSTCHVIIDPRWFKNSSQKGKTKGRDKGAGGIVEPPCEDEQDMLDLAYAPRKSSRLGCQIKLTESMDGMIIYLPKGANNLMDDIPFDG